MVSVAARELTWLKSDRNRRTKVVVDIKAESRDPVDIEAIVKKRVKEEDE